MRTFFIIILFIPLTGCFGYQVIKKSDLAFIRKANYLTGYMKCVNISKGGTNDKR